MSSALHLPDSPRADDAASGSSGLPFVLRPRTDRRSWRSHRPCRGEYSRRSAQLPTSSALRTRQNCGDVDERESAAKPRCGRHRRGRLSGRISRDRNAFGCPHECPGALAERAVAMSKTDWTRTHLCQILRAYADYYNRVRTHLSLEKDAPLGRPVQAIGSLATVPLLGGLHHEYVRMA